VVRQAAPPSGQLPPVEAHLRDGTTVSLAGLAAEASERHLARHPEEIARHGPYTADWCRHDLQWVLAWAVQDADGQPLDLLDQLDWLARILVARDYPAASLADALDELAAVVAPTLGGAAARLRLGAERVRQAAA
jgi:hypothetical protein